MFGHIIEGIRELIIYLPSIILAIFIHEYIRGSMAIQFGDKSITQLNRLSANPISYIDPAGLLCMVFFNGAGWSRSIIINYSNFKRRFADTLAVNFAACAANIVVSIVLIVLFWIINPKIGSPLGEFIYAGVEVNIKFGLINFIPIPPLSAGKALESVWEDLQRYEIIGIILIIAALFIATYQFQTDVIREAILKVMSGLRF